MKYRLSKYNPEYRNDAGSYMVNEWTDFSDIGREFCGKKLELEEYLLTEQRNLFYRH